MQTGSRAAGHWSRPPAFQAGKPYCVESALLQACCGAGSLCISALASEWEQAIALCGHILVQAGAAVSVSVQMAGLCALFSGLATL